MLNRCVVDFGFSYEIDVDFTLNRRKLGFLKIYIQHILDVVQCDLYSFNFR